PICIEATRGLTARTGDPPAVIVLTTFDGEANLLESIRAGAAGFLLKHTPPEEIVAAVRRAGRGEPVLSPSAARKLMDHVAGRQGPGARARERFARLTERERQVESGRAHG